VDFKFPYEYNNLQTKLTANYELETVDFKFPYEYNNLQTKLTANYELETVTFKCPSKYNNFVQMPVQKPFELFGQ
jgi:hypothetical protein